MTFWKLRMNEHQDWALRRCQESLPFVRLLCSTGMAYFYSWLFSLLPIPVITSAYRLVENQSLVLCNYNTSWSPQVDYPRGLNILFKYGIYFTVHALRHPSHPDLTHSYDFFSATFSFINKNFKSAFSFLEKLLLQSLNWKNCSSYPLVQKAYRWYLTFNDLIKNEAIEMVDMWLYNDYITITYIIE